MHSAVDSLKALIPRLDQALDALERGDLDAFTEATREQTAPHCEFHSGIGSVVGGGAYTGVEGIRSWFGDILATSSERRWRNRRYETFGDRVLLFLSEFEFVGEASGAPVATETGAVFEYEDGLCVRITSFTSHDEARGFASACAVGVVFRLMAESGHEGLLTRFDDIFDEEFEWHPALIGGLDGRTYRGRTEFEQYWRDFTSAFEEIDFGEPRAEPLGPDRVLAWGRLHVRGAGGGVPIDQEAAYVVDLRDGKLVAGRTFFSRAEAEEFAARA
ncbi:MAG TPA: nuclear transport factor 2 family protein [Solirubrobacterales bacterium]|nr:nuclear transport factor 2 family protein [Solirubrobacterales bacterium]